MLGVKGQPSTDGEHIIPKEAHGLKVMSIGFLVEEDTAMIWRGPMVTSALQQLLGDTLWGPLDYLIIDLPPGTGDIQLTLAQKIPVAGAVIVTTPQDIALLDARRAVHMFRKVDVPVLGVVENMSTHICTACGHEEAIFGHGGGEQMAKDFEIPLLGQIAIDDGNPFIPGCGSTHDDAESGLDHCKELPQPGLAYGGCVVGYAPQYDGANAPDCCSELRDRTR